MNYYLLPFLIYFFYLGIVKSYDSNTYIPGYNLDINGLSNQLNNQYFDQTLNIYKDCPPECGACNDQNTCTSCKFGYFLFSPVSNNNLYCVPCPLFNMGDIQNQILCADCVTIPLTWQKTKKCTYSYIKIAGITSQNVVRYEQYEDTNSIKLYNIFQKDASTKDVDVIEYLGGDSWCGQELLQSTPPQNCDKINNSFEVDQSQTAVRCKPGYVVNFDKNICEQCTDHCQTCYGANKCLVCSEGYTLGYGFQCFPCNQITNCLSCFYEDQIQNNLVTNPYLAEQLTSQQQLLDQGYKLRCNQCSYNDQFFIPSLDMTKCEDCSDLSDCVSCRYAKIDFGLVVDHSTSSYVVQQSELNDYGKYCLACLDPSFVNYNGKCEKCDIVGCEQCYYGTASGADSSYTLQQNFVYKNLQDNLIKKCAFCNYEISQSALLLDGQCQGNLSFLSMKDSSCAKWVQFKILPDQTTFDGSYFQCVECKYGGGFDISQAPQDRKCDQYFSVMNVPLCSSYYYTKVNGVAIGITCTRCEKGYVATATRGCVSCSNGITGANSMATIQSSTCNWCSLMTRTGFNYTYFLMTQTSTSRSLGIETEKKFDLPVIPFCNYCGSKRVYGNCQVSCFDKQNSLKKYSILFTKITQKSCYSEMGGFQGCISDSNQTPKCIACGDTQPYLLPWTLDQGVSKDSSQCIECPRYCLFCQERTQEEVNEKNPYFKPGYIQQLFKYNNKCIKCRSIDEICSDFSGMSKQESGYQLDCTKKEQYVMYYNPMINQCTPCPIEKPNCTRKLKIQQLLECRPQISLADQKLGDDQNNYYGTKVGGMGLLSNVFSSVGTIFLDSWNPTTSLSINFDEYASLDQDLQTYLALNEENVSDIEFEILLIPEVQDYKTADGTEKKNANVCIFPNDVNFSVKIAQNIASINKLSLTFKTVDPSNGIIGQEPIDMFITQFSFQGWNHYSFQNINFLPMYSKKTSVQIKNMLFDFSNNSFQSNLELKDVKFISGQDSVIQQKLLKQMKTIFCPVIDTTNLKQITINNVSVQNFQYQKFTSLFKFDQSSGNQVSNFIMNINKLEIQYCSFSQTNIIQIQYDTATINMNSITINQCDFDTSILINQIPGHNYAQSQHSLQINSLTFEGNRLKQSSILKAYNLLIFKLNSFTMNFYDKLGQDSLYALIITNIAVISQMKFSYTYFNSENVVMIQNTQIFQFPVSSSSAATPYIYVESLSFTSIQFSGTNGYIMNLSTYKNMYQIKGNVSVINLKIQNCQGDSSLSYLLYLSQIKLATVISVDIIDSIGFGFIYSENSEEINITNGNFKNSQFPSICKDGPLQINQPTIPYEKFHGTTLYVKNQSTLVYVENTFFENLCIIDRSLFLFTHEQRETVNLPSPITDTIRILIEDNVNKYTSLKQATSTSVVFNKCHFNKINSYVTNSNLVTTLFYFNTVVSYINLLLDVTATELNLFCTIQDALFKQSSSFMIQDSNPSSLILVGLSLQNLFSSLMVQNGILFNGSSFASIKSSFNTANYGKESQLFGYSGGFLNLQSKSITIQESWFLKSVSDQGGAVYIKTYSNSASVSIFNSHFIDLKSSFNYDGTGTGGAISIDATSSINLEIRDCEFDKIFSYKKGAVLDLTCGQGLCKINIIHNTITNFFAPTGSILNVKLNKITQTLTFNENTVSSSLTVDDTILPYNYFLNADSDILQLISQFYMIYIQGGAINFEQNIFDYVQYLQGLLYVAGGTMTFYKNKFSNSDYKFTPFIHLQKQSITKFAETDIEIMRECIDCLPENQKLYFLTNYTLTNFNNFILIENPTQDLSINTINISDVQCSQCTQGILGIQSSSKPVSVLTGTIKNNKSNQGILYFGGSSSSSSRMLQNQQKSAGAQITINSVIFQGNKANLGGAIYVSYNNLELISCDQILENTATQEGGAIYFLTSDSNPNTLKLFSTTITQNTAKIGGGIKVIGTFPQLLSNSVVDKNTASISGKDTTSYPTGLIVYQNKSLKPYDSNLKAVLLNQWSPGVSNDQELFAYLIGDDGKIQKLDSGQTATLTVSLNYPSNSQKPASAKISGTTTVNYDPIIGGFYLKTVEFQQKPLSQLLAKLESSIIKIPRFDSTGALTSIDTSYNLPLIINTRYCLIGEAFISTSGQCFLCASGTYSIVDNSTQCTDCPKVGVQNCPGGDVINIQSGYWRPSRDSDKIEECTNQLSNCAGGKGTGDQLCSEGHIGALCEVCDVEARFWLESYSNSDQYSCGKCKNTQNNTLKMIGLSVYTIIAIYFSVRSTKALLDSYIITFYFEKIGFMQKSAKQSTASFGIIIKLFTTYLQLIVVITTFNLQLPPGLSDITLNIGDPVKQMGFSMDCGLQKISGSIPMTYFRLIWSQLMPLLYVITYLIFHFLYQKIQKVKSRAVIAWIAFIYIYISMQPSVIKQNIQTISCRSISGIQYIKANVSEECYTSEHIKYTLALILPTLFVWVCLIPFYFLKNLYQGRHRLETIEMQYQLGFLYTEYKRTSYFWELVKIYQKTFVTFFINIYDSYNIIKGVLVIIVLVIYVRLQIKYQPYKEKRFNFIDIYLNLTVIASIIIAMFIQKNPFSYLIWFGYIILVTINSILIIMLLRILIPGYTQTIEAKIGGKLIQFSLKHPKIAKYLNLPLVPQKRIKELWDTFRAHFKQTYLLKVKDPENKIDQPDQVKQIDSKNKLIEYQKDEIQLYKLDLVKKKSKQNSQKDSIQNGDIESKSLNNVSVGTNQNLKPTQIFSDKHLGNQLITNNNINNNLIQNDQVEFQDDFNNFSRIENHKNNLNPEIIQIVSNEKVKDNLDNTQNNIQVININ